MLAGTLVLLFSYAANSARFFYQQHHQFDERQKAQETLIKYAYGIYTCRRHFCWTILMKIMRRKTVATVTV